MRRIFLTCGIALAVWPAISQTDSFNQQGGISANPPVDSGDYFLQKGLQEKQNGRRLESLIHGLQSNPPM